MDNISATPVQPVLTDEELRVVKRLICMLADASVQASIIITACKQTGVDIKPQVRLMIDDVLKDLSLSSPDQLDVTQEFVFENGFALVELNQLLLGIKRNSGQIRADALFNMDLSDKIRDGYWNMICEQVN